MNKKMVSLLLIMGIALVGLVGCVVKGRETQKQKAAPISVEAITEISKGGKTYVSKYGFSVTYPQDWELEESEYGLLAKGMEHGAAPFFLYSKSKNIGFDFGNDGQDQINNLFNNNYELDKYVKSSNLILDVYGQKVINIHGGKAYVFWGKSAGNKNAKFILALIPLTKQSDVSHNILNVSIEIFENDNFESIKTIFEKTLQWIKIL